MNDYVLGTIVAGIWAVVFYFTYHEKLVHEPKNKYWAALYLGVFIFVTIAIYGRDILFPLSK